MIDSPGPVELAVGESATLELEANPTTGYQWEPSAEPDAAVIRIVSDTYVAPDSAAMGAGGTQRIVIEGVAAGTTTLELRYVRPWEADADPRRDGVVRDHGGLNSAPAVRRATMVLLVRPDGSDQG